MGSLIAIVGNSGVGKTTLARHLSRLTGFQAGWEQLEERPFQQRFANELERYALANQVDYLLYRAEQEMMIRGREGIGIQDGGLDQDFHIFTRLFFERGYLDEAEFDVCRRLYELIRAMLPLPDAVIYLFAPVAVIRQRYERRGRRLEIARLEDLALMNELVHGWIATLDPRRVIGIDAGRDDFISPEKLAVLQDDLQARFDPNAFGNPPNPS